MPLVLGIAWPLPGCATREFVREEIARSEAALGPAVDQLAIDLQEHRAAMRMLTTQAAEVGRLEEEATRAMIEALGVADVAAGSAADAVDHATIALGRADEVYAMAEHALTEAEQNARRLTQLA